MNVGAGWGRPEWNETDAGTVRWARSGRAGPPVVLIPGRGYSSSPWRDIAPLARIRHSTPGRIDDAGHLLQEDAPARPTAHLLR